MATFDSFSRHPARCRASRGEPEHMGGHEIVDAACKHVERGFAFWVIQEVLTQHLDSPFKMIRVFGQAVSADSCPGQSMARVMPSPLRLSTPVRTSYTLIPIASQ